MIGSLCLLSLLFLNTRLYAVDGKKGTTDKCTADTLFVGCEGVVASNAGVVGTNGLTLVLNTAAGVPDANDRWASAANSIVWFRFHTDSAAGDPDSAWYTVTTDDGTFNYNTDAQLAIIRMTGDTCGGTQNLVKANEDVSLKNPSFHYRNSLAAQVGAKLKTNKWYWLVGDVFGTTTAQFRIAIVKNARPANDSIQYAIDITSSHFCAVDTCRHFVCKEYCYNPPGRAGATASGNANDTNATDGPTKDSVSDDLSHCNGSNTTTFALLTDHRDVWFKFHYDAANCDKKKWISVYPNATASGGTSIRYSMAIYDSNSTGSLTSNPITALDYEECSSGDDHAPQLNTFGGDGDVGKGNTPFAARINLDNFLVDGETYYVRVWVTGGGLPKDGFFILCVESSQTISSPATGPAIAGDGVSGNNCASAPDILGALPSLVNRTVDSLCLGNAGSTGNFRKSDDNTKNDDVVNEPLTYLESNDGMIARPCAATPISPGTVEAINENSVYYKFTVPAPDTSSITQSLPCLPGACATLQDQINTVSNFVDNVLCVTDPADCPTYQGVVTQLQNIHDMLCSGGDIPITQIKFVLNTLRTNLGCPTAVEPNHTICGIIDQIENTLDSCTVQVVSGCAPVVSVCFDNIKYNGINGDGAYFAILPNDTPAGCKNGQVIVGGKTSTEDAIRLIPAGSFGLLDGSMAPGTYFIAVNGWNGQLVSYDLHLSVTWLDVNTLEPCDTASMSMPKRTERNARHESVPGKFALNYIKPMPAKDMVEVSYSSPEEQNVTLTVTDVTGRTRYTSGLSAKSGSNSAYINVSEFSAGMYMLTIKSSTGVVFSKFVKVD